MKPEPLSATEIEAFVWESFPYARTVVKNYAKSRNLDSLFFYEQDFAALDAIIAGAEAARRGQIKAEAGRPSVLAWIKTTAKRSSAQWSKALIEEDRGRVPWEAVISEDGQETTVGRDEILKGNLTLREQRPLYNPLERLLLNERQGLLDPSPMPGRSIKIVELWRDGYSYSEIATMLHLGPGTVRKALEKYRALVRSRAVSLGYASEVRIAKK